MTVTIGGVRAQVLWAGPVGAGLYQINVTIPTTLPDGDHAVSAAVLGVTTQLSALVKVAASARFIGWPGWAVPHDPHKNRTTHKKTPAAAFAAAGVETTRFPRIGTAPRSVRYEEQDTCCSDCLS